MQLKSQWPARTPKMLSATRRLAIVAALLVCGPAAAADVGPIPYSNLGQPNGPAKLDSAGSLSGQTIVSTGASLTRTLGDRASDTRNLLDWSSPTDGGDYSLAMARLCAAVPGDMRVWLPASSNYYAFNSSVTTCGGRNLTIEGDGHSVTKIGFAGTGVLFDVTQNFATQTMRLANLTIASSSGTGSLAALRVTYPVVGSSNRPTVTVSNIEVVSPTSGALAGSFCKAVMITNGWNVRISDIQFTAQAVSPGVTGCAAVDAGGAGGTRDIFLSRVSQSYGDALFYQSGYVEGVHLDHPTVVGANWLYSQAASGITAGGGGVFGVLLTVNGGEINTVQGGLSLTNWHGVGVTNSHFSRWGSGAGTLVGYNLTGVNALRSTGDVFDGGSTTGAVTYAKISSGLVSSSNNVWIAPDVENAGTLANFGAGTVDNAILNAHNQSGSLVIDAGAGNLVSEITGTGHLRTYQPLIYDQPTGVTTQHGPNTSNFTQDAILIGSTAGGVGVRLTTDGAAAGAANCINVPAYSSRAISITLVGRSPTNHFVSVLPLVELTRDTSGSGTDTATLPAASVLTPTQQRGTTTGTVVFVGPDNTNKCLQVSVGPPTGEAWSYTARLSITAFQP